jgi:threonine dehydrogenase-like Zn-dependent dehydrogenase
MGEVVELGSAVKNVKKGDRVVVPFTISCGSCFFCNRDLWSLCDNSNPNAWMAEEMMGHSPSGLFGYSHLTGGYAGGQAEYARVPFADVGLFKIPDGLADEQVLFFTDIFPTGYMAAENCDIQPGDTVAIWGCGPVGQFAIRSAFMLGAGVSQTIDTPYPALFTRSSTPLQCLGLTPDKNGQPSRLVTRLVLRIFNTRLSILVYL